MSSSFYLAKNGVEYSFHNPLILSTLFLTTRVAVLYGFVSKGEVKEENKMRKQLYLVSLLGMSLSLSACSSEGPTSKTDKGYEGSRQQVQLKEKHMLDTRVKLTFDNYTVFVKMYDHPMSRDLLAQLPLTLTFKDYVAKEKISVLKKRLSSDHSQSKNKPKKGDFAYYSPWGNIAIFYKGHEVATNDLVILGQIESGKENFENLHGDFTLTMEKAH